MALLEDLTESLIEEGVDHILFLCGHGGNVPTIEHHARNLIHRGVLRVACIDIWRLITPEWNREIYGEPYPNTGHGSEPIGSVMAWVAPGMNRPDLLQKPGKAMYKGLPARGSQVDLNGVLFHVYPSSVDTSPVGVLGDPSLASPERGQKILDLVVKACCDVVNWFKTMDTSIPDVTPGQPAGTR